MDIKFNVNKAGQSHYFSPLVELESMSTSLLGVISMGMFQV